MNRIINTPGLCHVIALNLLKQNKNVNLFKEELCWIALQNVGVNDVNPEVFIPAQIISYNK